MACSLTMDGMLERDKLVTKQTLENANAGQVTEEQRRQNQLPDTALQMQQNNQQQQMDNAKQVLKIKNKTYFYKNDEALRSPMEEYDRRILGRGKSEKVNQIPLSAPAARQKNSWKRI